MILQLHSYWAYLTVTLLLVTFISMLIGYLKNKTFQIKDLRISLYVLIFSHIQLLLGFAYYFTSPSYKHLKEIGMRLGMKDAHLRMLTIEHPIMMILAIVLISLGFSKLKKQVTDKAKFKTISIYYGIGLVLILSRIPWDQWFD